MRSPPSITVTIAVPASMRSQMRCVPGKLFAALHTCSTPDETQSTLVPPCCDPEVNTGALGAPHGFTLSWRETAVVEGAPIVHVAVVVTVTALPTELQSVEGGVHEKFVPIPDCPSLVDQLIAP